LKRALPGVPTLVATATLVCASACADSFRALGPNPAVAEVRAGQLVGALASRYLPVEREPRYDLARVKLAKAALVPSRAFDDTIIWTVRTGATSRALHIQGAAVASHYVLEAKPALAPAVNPGDSRHTISLLRTGGSTFRWDTDVAFALGSLTADDAGAVFNALFTATDGKTPTEIRADYRAIFPAAAAAFGRGFSIDSLTTVPSGPGVTSVSLTLAFHPERLSATYPAFTSYLDRYFRPAKYHFEFVDRSGTPMFDIAGRDRMMTLRYRVAKTGLVALSGLPRPMGDTLQLRADVSMKVKLWTVAFRGLVTDFVITRGAHERAWTIVAQKEPDWDLPLVTERLIRSSLHHPFEGAGAMLRLSMRDTAGGQTMFARRIRLDVQESTIVRFIGSLGAHMMGDISDKVELEEYRFLREGFLAFAADVQGLGKR
jgi:hypothetical protein